MEEYLARATCLVGISIFGKLNKGRDGSWNKEWCCGKFVARESQAIYKYWSSPSSMMCPPHTHILSSCCCRSMRDVVIIVSTKLWIFSTLAKTCLNHRVDLGKLDACRFSRLNESALALLHPSPHSLEREFLFCSGFHVWLVHGP